MLIRKQSQLTGKIHDREIEGITKEQLDRFLAGEKVQNVFPFLSADDREFLLTGVTPEEWDTTFGKLDEETI